MAKRGRSKAGSGNAQKVSNVRAVERAVSILQAFTPEQPSMSVLDIQRRVGLSRPTLYRLMHTLSQKGFIRSEGDPQRFTLGHGVMQLAHIWLRGLDAVGVARPVLEELRDQTGETTALFALRNDRGVCVLECTSPHVLTISRGVGHTVVITQGATGKAVLSCLPAGQQKEFFDHLPKAQRVRLEEDIARVRKTGFAISKGEVFVGAVAVAAPYFDHRGEVVGSVGLYGPEARISGRKIERFGALVAEAARDVSRLLGFESAAK